MGRVVGVVVVVWGDEGGRGWGGGLRIQRKQQVREAGPVNVEGNEERVSSKTIPRRKARKTG